MVKILAAALAAFIGCASGGVPLDQPFKVKVGEAVRVADLLVKFAAVPSDSRCPPDVNCIWEGDAVVRLEVSRGETRETAELHTHNREKASTFRNEIELRALTRAPYVAEIVIRRKTGT